MTLDRVKECVRGLVNMTQARRRLRAEMRQQRRRNREYQKALQIGSTTCGECNRQLRVMPFELSPSEDPTGNPRSDSAEDVAATYAGTFHCPCGALGWMRGAYILAPRDGLKGPSATQTRFLEALAHGEQSHETLSEDFDFNDPATVGELILADDAGWVSTSLGGIGGLLARPSPSYALTDRGREALTRSPSSP
jgi:hypothetical protein